MKLKVDTDRLSMLATDLYKAIEGINTSLDQLDIEIAALDATWSGDAHDAFMAAESTWASGMRDSAVDLTELFKLLSHIQVDYLTAEQANRDTWP